MVECILAFFCGVGSAAPSRHKHRTAESTLEIYRGMLRGRRAVFCDVGGVVGWSGCHPDGFRFVL